MNSREFLEQLHAAAGLPLEEELEYIAVTAPGAWAFQRLLNGKPVGAFFEIIERALTQGDDSTQNLCVVGLFESLQNQNFQQGAPDLVENRLGTHSRQAWANLIQGWMGEGIRDIAGWRNHNKQTASGQRSAPAQLGQPSTNNRTKGKNFIQTTEC